MASKSFSTEVVAEGVDPQLPSTHVDPAPSFASSDIEIPRLQVVQKLSDLEIEAPLGSIVHNKDTVVYRSGTKVPSVVVYAQKYWKEDIPFESDEIPQFAHTQAEADAIAEQNGPDGYKVITSANIALLIAKTDDAEPDSDGAFPFFLDGRYYGIGKFTVQKKSYDTTFKSLASFMLFNPQIDASTIHWNLSSFMTTKGKFSWYVPSLNPTTEKVGPEALAFIARLKG